MSTRVVSIVQRRMTHYRLPLFTQMRDLLAARNVTLRVLHGDGTAAEASKADAGALAWATRLPTRYLLDGRICWQPFMAQAAGSDLVIVTQENKQVNNLLAMLSPRRPALAFWGHGRNMQSNQPDGLLERFKRWTTNRVDWWFAYTELSAAFVRGDGYPAERITVLNNSIDTQELRADVDLARKTPRAALREALGLRAEGPVGIFVGSLYADKRIGFLLDAAQHIQALVPDFQLVLAGNGPERSQVEAAAARHAHVHYLGNVRGARKAQLLAAADVMLNPGLVGLGILDAFVAGVPMLTTDCHIHSPEISYLQHDDNGLMTADTLAAYVEATVGLLGDPSSLQRLSRGAAAASGHYSVERMAQRFVDGICDCLDNTPRRR